jgi:proline dehydrogenase
VFRTGWLRGAGTNNVPVFDQNGADRRVRAGFALHRAGQFDCPEHEVFGDRRVASYVCHIGPSPDYIMRQLLRLTREGSPVIREPLIRLSQQAWLREFVTHNRIAHGMANRFVAGETAAQALHVVREINSRGMTATLDHLGENVTSKDEARQAADTYCQLLRSINEAGADTNASLKLSALGLDLGKEIAEENLRKVVATAADLDNFIRIDMESSEYIDRTLEMFYRVWEEHQNIGVVIQACLYRSESDLERLIDARARVRLVKGAYLEPAALAFGAKSDVDKNFLRLAKILLERGNYPAIATHDVRMLAAVKRYAMERGIDHDQFEFQMLYGIRRDLQTQLVRDGFRLRIYVPYGIQWYPYLTRRMAERPANLMFVVGNVLREARPERA